MSDTKNESTPLENLDQWEEFVETATYPEPEHKKKDDYRNYDDPARDCVKEFYRLNHKYQTFDFVMKKHEEILGPNKVRKEMTVIQAIELLDTLVDDSDPDIALPQIQHLLQTSESIRTRGYEDWFVLTGLIHDLGKLLCLEGEPQWAVVGDTFPVGCQYSDKIVYPEFFEANPDADDSRYNTRLGVYEEGCGLHNVDMSWGHDEFMYRLVKDYLPDPALYMIRYHSFYAWHREGQYEYLLDDHDRAMLPWVKRFNPFDLYTKCPVAPVW
ncbi:MAG: inositol oxygenase family protein, partial [Opitutaceae bacterium]|nr:inositol oxygenase family protein [Opitutaceae bacterium]